MKPSSIKEDYNEKVKDYYRLVEDYDWVKVTDNMIGLESLIHKNREWVVRKYIKKYGKGKYLDVGCGAGLILRHLPEGSDGIDINPRNIARVKKYVPKANVILGDAEHLPYPDQQFDTVICTETLEHLVRPDLAASEIKRVLKPGGILIGSVPRRSLIWRFRFLSSTHPGDEPFHHEYNGKELADLLAIFPRVETKTSLGRANLLFIAFCNEE
ncbi:class I SAM-dependent methyltransferase [Patescibacteria group bacterium]|nr:class I SAM-dependent methyltransferase [Patescibacteria group bacterium]